MPILAAKCGQRLSVHGISNMMLIIMIMLVLHGHYDQVHTGLTYSKYRVSLYSGTSVNDHLIRMGTCYSAVSMLGPKHPHIVPYTLSYPSSGHFGNTYYGQLVTQ